MLPTQHFQVEPVQTTAAVPQDFDAARRAEQKALNKAAKKERKHERLRSFYSWCAACQAYGSMF